MTIRMGSKSTGKNRQTEYLTKLLRFIFSKFSQHIAEFRHFAGPKAHSMNLSITHHAAKNERMLGRKIMLNDSSTTNRRSTDNR